MSNIIKYILIFFILLTCCAYILIVPEEVTGEALNTTHHLTRTAYKIAKVEEKIICDFEGINETVQWQMVDFESIPGTYGGWKTYPRSAVNFYKTNVNESDSCAYFEARVENAAQQITIWLTMPGDYLDVTSMPYVHIMMRCENSATWKMQLYDGTYKTAYVFSDYNRVGEWQDLVFDFESANLQNMDLQKTRHIKFRYEGIMPFNADSLYLDQVLFSNNPVPAGELPTPDTPVLYGPEYALSGTNINLSWNESHNHTAYLLEESKNLQFTSSNSIIIPDTIMHYDLSHVTDQTEKYYYRIRAVHEPTNKFSEWSNIVQTFVVPDTLVPATPVLSGADTVDSGQNYMLGWTGSANATHYLLQESEDDEFSFTVDNLYDYRDLMVMLYRIVNQPTSLFYRVRSENRLVDKVSDWSNVIHIHVKAIGHAQELGCGTTYTEKLIPDRYDDFPTIKAGEWWIDHPFNTKVIRVTDSGERDRTYAEHRYSSVCAFNLTGDYFICTHKPGDVWLHDGRNGTPIRQLKLFNTYCVWSMQDADLIYYCLSNQLRRYNVKTDQDDIVRTFIGESDIDIGGNEGDISNDGRYMCFSSTDRTRWFVYDLVDDIKFSVLEVDDPKLIDAAQISPSGNYVVIEYGYAAANNYQEGVGCCVHESKTMDFVNNIYYLKTQHNDVGFDMDGEEAMFIPDVHGDFSGAGPSAILSVKILGAEKKLLHRYEENTWLAYHFSQRCCMNRSDYVFAGAYNKSAINPQSAEWKPYWNEILAISTDPSKETVRLCHHRCNGMSPRPSVNRQGDRIVFDSNLHDVYEWSDVFMLTLEEPDTIPPYAPEDLRAVAIQSNRIELRWDEPYVAIDGDLPRTYKLMRDSVTIAYTQDVTYIDTMVMANTNYTYEVYSIDESAVSSNFSASLTVSSSSDLMPPEVMKIVPLGLKAIAVHFNEALETTSALDTINYTFSDGIKSVKMALACDDVVLIETSQQTQNETYSLLISGIRDASPNHNQMSSTFAGQFIARQGSDIAFHDYQDNFDVEHFENYEFRRRELWDYAEDNGRLVFGTNTSEFTYPGPGRIGSYALVKDKIFTDFKLSCEARTVDSREFEFIWNYQDDYNYNYVMIHKVPTNNELFLLKDSMRYTITPFSDFAGLDDNDYHSISVEVKSGHFAVSFDDSIIVQGEDNTFKYGKVGMGSFGGWDYFDNLSIIIDEENIVKTEPKEIVSIPGGFHVFQNYPNPFNAETKINYVIDKPCEIEISIFNIKGQCIEKIRRKMDTSGNHSFKWNALQYPSGIYFYEVCIHKDYRLRRKMLLLK